MLAVKTSLDVRWSRTCELQQPLGVCGPSSDEVLKKLQLDKVPGEGQPKAAH